MKGGKLYLQNNQQACNWINEMMTGPSSNCRSQNLYMKQHITYHSYAAFDWLNFTTHLKSRPSQNLCQKQTHSTQVGFWLRFRLYLKLNFLATKCLLFMAHTLNISSGKFTSCWEKRGFIFDCKNLIFKKKLIAIFLLL